MITTVWVCRFSSVFFVSSYGKLRKDNNDSELFQTKLVRKGLVTQTYKSLCAKTGFNELDWNR